MSTKRKACRRRAVFFSHSVCVCARNMMRVFFCVSVCLSLCVSMCVLVCVYDQSVLSRIESSTPLFVSRFVFYNLEARQPFLRFQISFSFFYSFFILFFFFFSRRAFILPFLGRESLLTFKDSLDLEPFFHPWRDLGPEQKKIIEKFVYRSESERKS